MKIKKLICVLAALLLALTLGCAAAEELPGNLPSRGMSIPMTQADLEAGIEFSTYMEVLDLEGNKIPAAVLCYCSPVFYEAYNDLENVYATGNFGDYDEIAERLVDHYYVIARFYLTSNEEQSAIVKGFDERAQVLSENDGYTYLLSVYDVEPKADDDAALFEAADKRIRELLTQISYQSVELTAEDLAERPQTEVPNAFPKFSTLLLSGEAVDNSIFADKDLTIINIWGTSCYPCISEMPELEAWSKELPDNVQLVGLVCDASAGSFDGQEVAQMICEATGVTYPNLLYCADFAEMLSGMPFTPTTIFVDRNGVIIGEPICGAYVDQYKEFVNNFLSAM